MIELDAITQLDNFIKERLSEKDYEEYRKLYNNLCIAYQAEKIEQQLNIQRIIESANQIERNLRRPI